MEHLTGIKPEWIHIFVVTMTRREREQWLYTLEQRAQGLKIAMELGKPNLAFGVYDDARLQFQCIQCDYAKTDKCDLGYDSRLKQIQGKKDRMKEYRNKK